MATIVSERINKILDIKGLNVKQLAEKMGLERPQALYDIQKGKTKSITDNIANKILSVFPDVSRMWILTGEGDVLIQDDSKKYAEGHQSDQVTKLIDELSAQRRMTEKALEQNDRLITLLEKEAERTEVIVAQKRV